MRFVYSVVRFVPDPGRGEFINVGAIAGSDELQEWSVRQIENPKRARLLGDAELLTAVLSFLGRIGSLCDEFEKGDEELFPRIQLNEEWLEDLCKSHYNMVQLSPPAITIAESVDEALNDVFKEFIVDPAQRSYAYQTKNQALAGLRRAYKDLGLNKGQGLFEKVMLETLQYHQPFDFAVANGQALQLTQSWSFQIPDQEDLSKQIKSWGWTVKDLKESGGQIESADGQRFEVGKDANVAVAYISPTESQQSIAHDEAMHVFESLQIDAFSIEDVSQIASRAKQLL